MKPYTVPQARIRDEITRANDKIYYNVSIKAAPTSEQRTDNDNGKNSLERTPALPLSLPTVVRTDSYRETARVNPEAANQ